MGKINYQNVLNALIREYPHDINAFRNIKKDITLPIETILKNNDWTVDEKIELINIFEHNPKLFKPSISIKGSKKEVSCLEYLLEYSYYTSLEAVIRHSYTVKEGISAILNHYVNIIKYGGFDERKFEKLDSIIINLIDTLNDEERRELFKSYISYSKGLEANPILETIIKLGDKKLLSMALAYVDDINLSFPWAVETANMEVISFYLELGADPFYTCKDEKIKYTPAIEVAITTNNHGVFKKLAEYSVDTNHFNELLKFASVIDFEAERYPNDKIKFANKNHMKNEIPKEMTYGYRNIRRYEEDLIENRRLIINDLWNLSNNENKDNLLDVLIFSIISKNCDDFNNYASILKEENIPYNIEDIINALIYNKSYENALFYETFINTFAPLHENLDLNYEIMKRILDKKFSLYGHNGDTVHGTIHILYKVKEENRKNLVIMPYVQDEIDLINLLRAGYDLNAHENNQDSLLFITLKKWCYNDDLDTICHYIINHYDIKDIENTEGKKPFQFLIEHFKEVLKAELSSGRLTNKEQIIKRVVNVIEKLVKKYSTLIIVENMPYLNELFTEYLKKQCWQSYLDDLAPLLLTLACYDVKYDNNVLQAIEYILKKEYKKNDNEKLKDIDKRVSFYFTHLDNDKELGDTTINKQYETILAFLGTRNLEDKDAFELFLEKLKEFDKTIGEAKKFEKEHIAKKRMPKFFKTFMHNEYKVNYFEQLDIYLANIIVAVFGRIQTEDKIKVLKTLKHFDINHYFVKFDTYMPYYHYENQIYDDNEERGIIEGRFEPFDIPYSDETGTVVFDGYLTEYATITNDIPLLRYLVSRRAKLPIMDGNGKDITLNYVSSNAMEEYIKSCAYNSSLGGLHNDEADYLKKILTNPEE